VKRPLPHILPTPEAQRFALMALEVKRLSKRLLHFPTLKDITNIIGLTGDATNPYRS
jgi:hypothetical protein